MNDDVEALTNQLREAVARARLMVDCYQELLPIVSGLVSTFPDYPWAALRDEAAVALEKRAAFIAEAEQLLANTTTV